MFMFLFLSLGRYISEGVLKLRRKYKIGYGRQSVQSVASKLSWFSASYNAVAILRTFAHTTSEDEF